MKFSQTKSYAPKNRVHTREKAPRLKRDEKGIATLLCPFCTPPHMINTENVSPCGTILQVKAVQTIYKSKKGDDRAVCVKCGKSGGEMAIFQGALSHINDCMPGVVALSSPPKYSRFAKYVHGMKAGWIKAFIIHNFGTPVQVEEVTPTAERTGVIFGYFFKKRGKNVRTSNIEREHAPSDTGGPISETGDRGQRTGPTQAQ